MQAEVKNAREIRGVLDGGRLQFKAGRYWVSAGGDAQCWITLLTLTDTRDREYRIEPGSIPDGVGACGGKTVAPSGTDDSGGGHG